MRDLITSGVRTAVQVAVAAIVGWLAQFGIDVPTEALGTVLFAIATGVVTIALNWLQSKFSWIGAILSLGLSRSTPSYR